MNRHFDKILTWYFDLPPSDQSWDGERFWRLESIWGTQSNAALMLAICVSGLSVGLMWTISRRQQRLKRSVLLLSRLSIMILALLLILQIQLRTVTYGRPEIALLIDTSSSMSLGDQYPQQQRKALTQLGVSKSNAQRIQIVKELLTGRESLWLETVRSRFDLEVSTFSDQISQHALVVAPADVPNVSSVIHSFRADGPETHLLQILDDIAKRNRSKPLAAVVLLSDGNASVQNRSAISATGKRLRRQNVPILSVGLGAKQSENDLQLESVQYELVGFANESHPLSVVVSANAEINQRVTVRVESLETEEVLAFKTISNLQQETPVQIDLVIEKLAPGANEIAVEVLGMPGELDFENNQRRIRIWGRETNLNLLVIEREPRWEYRHLKSTLERDAHVVVDTYLANSDAAYSIEDRTALQHLPDSLDDYDAVVLGDIDFSAIDQNFLDELLSFLQRGRGLLLLPGHETFRSISPTHSLIDLFPASVAKQDPARRIAVQAVVTAEGIAQRSLPIEYTEEDFRTFPELYPFSRKYTLNPGAIELISGRSSETGGLALPLVLMMRYGSGFVIQHLFDDSWRWKEVDNSHFYSEFWSQTIRNICRQRMLDQLPALELLSERETYALNEVVRLQLIDRQDQFPNQPIIKMTLFKDRKEIGGFELRRSNVTKGLFVGELERLTEGEYVSLFSPLGENENRVQASWTVAKADTEMAVRTMNENLLRSLSETSNGDFFYPWEFEKVADALPKQKVTEYSEMVVIPLWNRWELLAFLIAFLTLEWTVRRREGIE